MQNTKIDNKYLFSDIGIVAWIYTEFGASVDYALYQIIGVDRKSNLPLFKTRYFEYNLAIRIKHREKYVANVEKAAQYISGTVTYNGEMTALCQNEMYFPNVSQIMSVSEALKRVYKISEQLLGGFSDPSKYVKLNEVSDNDKEQTSLPSVWE